jgi:hypothetical protein
MARKSWPGENVGAGDGHSGGALRRILGSIKRTKEVDTVNVEGGDGYSQQATETPQEQGGGEMSETAPDNEGSTPAKAEQTFQDEKAARREQRRSMQESGDYLGVQVPNPRTGYWDISDTTNTDPSQISEGTKRNLDEKAREVDEQKKKYEEAQTKHQPELRNVLAIKEMKKKEKAQEN